MKFVYIAAVNPKEATDLAKEGIGCDTVEEAALVLEDILKEADPSYAKMYKIYKRRDPFA